MILCQIKFTHYSPKDHEKGTKGWVVVKSENELIKYLDEKYLCGTIREGTEDDEYYPGEDWWLENENKKQDLAKHRLKLNDDAYVVGRASDISKWFKGTGWQEVSDAYYGVTHWDWSNMNQIDKADKDTLVRLGLAKDLTL